MVIKLTQTAITQLAKIQKPNNFLKLFVSSGGCSGVQWELKHADLLHKNDEKVSDHLVVDHMSVFHLLGSVLDYQITLKASEFVLKNPNAQHACGCGKSFSL